MSKAKQQAVGHTPGPWVREDVNTEHLHDICVGYDIPGAGSPVLLASVFFDDDLPGIPLEQATHNARLIAAAPDLLEACRFVLDNAGGPPVDMLSKIRAAVEKATGSRG